MNKFCKNSREEEVYIIDPISVFIALVLCLLGVGGGYMARKNVAEGKIGAAEDRAKEILEEAMRDAEAKKKEALLEAKEEIHRLRSEMERENKERRAELSKNERRLVQKEENVDKKMDAYEKKEEKLIEQSNRLQAAQAKVDALYGQQVTELERISGLTSDEAKQELLDNVLEEVKHDKARLIKDMEQEAKDDR